MLQDGLVAQAQRGDAEAFDTLARMTGDRCLAIAVRILRDIDLAEDAVQAALITAWTELRTLRDPAPARVAHLSMPNGTFGQTDGLRTVEAGRRVSRDRARGGLDGPQASRHHGRGGPRLP